MPPHCNCLLRAITCRGSICIPTDPSLNPPSFTIQAQRAFGSRHCSGPRTQFHLVARGTIMASFAVHGGTCSSISSRNTISSSTQRGLPAMRQPGAGGRLLLPVRSPSALEHAGDIMPLFRGWNIVLRNHACVTIGSITGAAANAVQQHAHCLPMPMPQARPLGGAALQPLRRGQMPIPAPQLPATNDAHGSGGRRGWLL